MIKNRFTQIGVDRLVRLAWLEKVSSLVLAGNEPSDIKSILQTDLSDSFRSGRTDVRGSLDKTITILLRVWARPAAELRALREMGTDLLESIPKCYHVVVHWGMVMATYPFWLGVAKQAGRLSRLQDSVSAAQVQRRVREEYGERETVSRRARYVLRSFVDWGVLQETKQLGTYDAGTVFIVDDPRLVTWLVEASLHTCPDGCALLKEVVGNPGLFPFRIRPTSAETLMAVSPRLAAVRHGLDSDLVMLKRPAFE